MARPIKKPSFMSTLFNFLHQNPLKLVFSHYFYTEISPLINDTLLNKCQSPGKLIREYTIYEHLHFF